MTDDEPRYDDTNWNEWFKDMAERRDADAELRAQLGDPTLDERPPLTPDELAMHTARCREMTIEMNQGVPEGCGTPEPICMDLALPSLWVRPHPELVEWYTTAAAKRRGDPVPWCRLRENIWHIHLNPDLAALLCNPDRRAEVWGSVSYGFPLPPMPVVPIPRDATYLVSKLYECIDTLDSRAELQTVMRINDVMIDDIDANQNFPGTKLKLPWLPT